MKSALLWYRLFHDTLQDLGFILNPYDPCAANAQIKGSQCTIVWYVDDNKIPHKDQTVVNDIIQRIEAKFSPMTKTQGDDHEFLGMKLHFNHWDKTVKILMQTYIDEAIHQSQLDMRRAAATPATKSLFEIDPNAAQLSPPEFERFQSVVCKLLYIALQGRPDILLAVVFLAIRVSRATLQDQMKLINDFRVPVWNLRFAPYFGSTRGNETPLSRLDIFQRQVRLLRTINQAHIDKINDPSGDQQNPRFIFRRSDAV